jgi:hypothetical protein
VGESRHGRRTRTTLPAVAAALGLVSAALVIAFPAGGAGKPARLGLAADDQSIPLLGSSVLSTANLDRATTQFGHMPIVRVYYPGLPPFHAWQAGLAGANKSAVIVSFKALPRTILSGADDAALRHFFDTAPTGHPIYYAYYHEPEDNIAAGQFGLGAYKAAWKRVVALADAAHNPFLRSTLILMEYDLVPASGRNWKNYLPGGRIISVLGWDAYPVGSATNVRPRRTAPARFMGPAIAASRSVGLPYGFAEFGLSTRRGRPGWLAKVGRYLMHSRALFGSLFNGNERYPTLRLTDPGSVAVWRGYVRDSAAARRAPVPQPLPGVLAPGRPRWPAHP